MNSVYLHVGVVVGGDAAILPSAVIFLGDRKRCLGRGRINLDFVTLAGVAILDDLKARHGSLPSLR